MNRMMTPAMLRASVISMSMTALSVTGSSKEKLKVLLESVRGMPVLGGIGLALVSWLVKRSWNKRVPSNNFKSISARALVHQNLVGNSQQ
mmetsp:Transcript_59365/g.98373  ORF Transcript_59365/g.98373 Transcript_59365/m.98373 type:complete len:90 (+) Transcript_59365:661-930(+)